MTNVVTGGRTNYGEAVGILMLDTQIARLPGDIGNATTWRFPVRYLTVAGATGTRVVRDGDPALLLPFVEAAKQLEHAGVRAIATSCGFLAMFHRELAAAVEVPVFTSSLLLVPLLHQTLKPGQRVGILTANSETLGERHFNGVGWSAAEIPIAVEGLQKWPHFREVFLGDRAAMDVDLIAAEIVDAAQTLVARHSDVATIVLECTNMAPYAHLIQKAVHLPVFDIQVLVNMAFAAVQRDPYDGHM